MIGMASSDNPGVLFGLYAKFGPCGHRWQKVAQNAESERNDIELASFHNCTRFDELVILVGSNVKNG